MKKWTVCIIMLFVCAMFASEVVAESAHRLGVGVHYWRTVDSIEEKGVDDSGMAYMFSYQYAPAYLLKLELDLEVFPEDFAGAPKRVFAPQALLLVGSTVYAGIGVGSFYSDGDFSEDPFYLVRAGLDFEILPNIFAEFNASYHFSDLDDLNEIDRDIDSDTVTLGAAIRIKM